MWAYMLMSGKTSRSSLAADGDSDTAQLSASCGHGLEVRRTAEGEGEVESDSLASERRSLGKREARRRESCSPVGVEANAERTEISSCSHKISEFKNIARLTTHNRRSPKYHNRSPLPPPMPASSSFRPQLPGILLRASGGPTAPSEAGSGAIPRAPTFPCVLCLPRSPLQFPRCGG